MDPFSLVVAFSQSFAGLQDDIGGVCYVFIAIAHILTSNSHSLWLSSKLVSLHVYLSKSRYTWCDRIRTSAPAQSQNRSPQILQLTMRDEQNGGHGGKTQMGQREKHTYRCE